MAGENSSKATEDLQVAEDKVTHLNKIKSKLEQTLDELEDSLNKEKKARTNIEKEEEDFVRFKRGPEVLPLGYGRGVCQSWHRIE